MNRLPSRDAETSLRFHQLFYELNNDRSNWQGITWLGIPVWKNPCDLWIYQEIISEIRPSLIVEIGTKRGGSALYMASILEMVGFGRVISIDKRERAALPEHPRIEYIVGDSLSDEVQSQVAELAASHDVVLINLDSHHSEQHVRSELQFYSRLVTPGSYIIVEDTNLNGRPVRPDYGPGPYEAVAEFLSENQQFYSDFHRERLLLTYNHTGFLRRRDQ